MIKAYYYLTKPGIIYGNALPTIAGFLLASRGHFDFKLFVSTLIGLSLVIACGCVFNNLMDRGIDVRMERTKNRASVTGKISAKNAFVYGVILGLVGFLILFLYTNILTVGVALVGAIVYVGIYTPMKPRSMYATLVGSIAGAVPPVVGYVAVSNKLDLGAWILFLILVTWQMPHFYAIAIRRLEDYKAASIPVLPAEKGIWFTKINMLVYIALFIFAVASLTWFGYTGYVYLVIAVLLGLVWLRLGLIGLRKGIDDKTWARKMFFLSLIVLTTLSVTISISGIMNK